MLRKNLADDNGIGIRFSGKGEFAQPANGTRRSLEVLPAAITVADVVAYVVMDELSFVL
jgi:hypothetical protein